MPLDKLTLKMGFSPKCLWAKALLSFAFFPVDFGVNSVERLKVTAIE